jgi:hypothetical protein
VRQGNLNPYSAARRIIEDRTIITELLSQGSTKGGQE